MSEKGSKGSLVETNGYVKCERCKTIIPWNTQCYNCVKHDFTRDEEYTETRRLEQVVVEAAKKWRKIYEHIRLDTPTLPHDYDEMEVRDKQLVWAVDMLEIHLLKIQAKNDQGESELP